MPRRRRKADAAPSRQNDAAQTQPPSRFDRTLHFFARFRGRHIALVWIVLGILISSAMARDSFKGRWLLAFPLAVLAFFLLALWIKASYRYRGRR
jgi:hypothetical protein